MFGQDIKTERSYSSEGIALTTIIKNEWHFPITRLVFCPQGRILIKGEPEAIEALAIFLEENTECRFLAGKPPKAAHSRLIGGFIVYLQLPQDLEPDMLLANIKEGLSHP